MVFSKVIGEGSYGCVHNPSLYCEDAISQDRNGKISKILATEYAEKEMKEYDVMEQVDPTSEYYVGKPTMCPVNKRYAQNKIAIANCIIGREILSDMDKFSLLVMNDGGEDLNKYGATLKMLPATAANEEKAIQFWLEAYRIIQGLDVFAKNDVLHNDMKHQNMVYNEDKNRINFIDFGLMDKKTDTISKAKSSTYGMASFHWSYPWEAFFWNKSRYELFVGNGTTHQNNVIKHLIESIGRPPNAPNVNHKFRDACTTFLNVIIDSRLSRDHRQELVDRYLVEYSRFLSSLRADGYDAFLEKSLSTIDSYGVAMGFLYVLNRSKHLIPGTMFTKLQTLFERMVSPDVHSRFTVEQAIPAYQNIMLEEGVLAKYNKQFDSENMLIDVPPLSPAIIGAIESVKLDDVVITPRELSLRMVSPVRQCEEGKELNPLTKRCVLKCKPGFARDATFKCKKVKESGSIEAHKVVAGPRKTRKNQQQVKPCPAGKTRNPRTKRCVAICKPGFVRDADFKCVKA